MKKALIPALLVVSAAFAPCLRSTLGFADRACEIESAVASPLFWQLWDELLSRGLSRWTSSVLHLKEDAEWRPELRKAAIACVFFHAFVKRAFDEFSSYEQENEERDQAFCGAVQGCGLRASRKARVVIASASAASRPSRKTVILVKGSGLAKHPQLICKPAA
jgi:hypothetical protein